MGQGLKVLAIIGVCISIIILGILEVQQSSLSAEIDKVLNKKHVTVVGLTTASAEEITLRSDPVSHTDTLEKKDPKTGAITKLFVMKTGNPGIASWWIEVCEPRKSCKEIRLPHDKRREMHNLYNDHMGR